MLGLKKKKECDNCSISASGIDQKETQGPELPESKVY